MSKKTKTTTSRTLSTYLLLHFAVFVLSLGTVCSKFAANQEFMSFGFIALYSGVIGTLGIYAVIWQQVLKRIPLTNAFVNKSATLFWSLLWGVLLFNETITLSMVIGILVVFFGVILVVSGNIKNDSAELYETKKELSDE